MALHNFPALLRGRGSLSRLRDGADSLDSGAQAVSPRGFHYRAASRQHGQGHARDRTHRGLRLYDRNVYGLVQRGPLPALHDGESHVRPVWAVIRSPDPLQYFDTAISVEPEGTPECGRIVLDRHSRQYWDVARALRDCRGQPPPRFYALRLGHVLPHAVGLFHILRLNRFVPVIAVPVPAISAPHFHFR